MNHCVILHYHNQEGHYSNLTLRQEQDGQKGKELTFSYKDSFGALAYLDCETGHVPSQVFVSVKRDYLEPKPVVVYKIERQAELAETEVWIVEGDQTIYHSKLAAQASAFFSPEKKQSYDLALNSLDFDRKWGFSGWLGFKFQKEETTFRLWAPTATKVELIFYASSDNNAPIVQKHAMTRGQSFTPDQHEENTHGVWEISLKGDYNFTCYSYRLYDEDQAFRDSRDPYSIAATANGRRSVLISSEDLIPDGFKVKQREEATWRLENPNKAVIYEMHVRDFSISENSGISAEKRGKFKGLIEEGTLNDYGDATGFDYIKALGVTHIQLQPIFDHHQSFDENGNYAYNWGYDPENYNVPEASFASNPHDPANRILELKKVIQAYHDAGLNVIMDVVYNHTYSSRDSAFQLTVPDYYYRMQADGSFQNGSGCGNETASEKEMFRKYMIDSLLYWIREYNIDGFRFDLMGLHDIETMNLIREEVDKIDPRILLYGEGWDMGNGLSADKKAMKSNAHQLPRIGFFNDDQRNAIKGAEIFGDLVEGFVTGAATEEVLAKAIIASEQLADYSSPDQVINYVEAHDNYNLNDLFWALKPNDSLDIHRKRVQLATAMNILMQGVTFMQIGQEFLRTKLFATGKDNQLSQEDKERAMNSYCSSDQVNQVDWNQVSLEKETVDFVRNLISLKTKTPYFSYQTFEEIRKHVSIESAEKKSGFISFSIKDKRKYQLVFSYHTTPLQLSDKNIIETNDKHLKEEAKVINDLTALILDMTE
ncbi:type I pullulanase [Streptococcus catagoni]|uniref:type I pullulanase n=1 Tax=Streptococcus catagoni TaxID=2654874 RepID=UPI00140980F6|nr:type I pullulanase [Streptococcus catagoni]